jgi:hypothetical protein
MNQASKSSSGQALSSSSNGNKSRSRGLVCACIPMAQAMPSSINSKLTQQAKRGALQVREQPLAEKTAEQTQVALRSIVIQANQQRQMKQAAVCHKCKRWEDLLLTLKTRP